MRFKFENYIKDKKELQIKNRLINFMTDSDADRQTD